MLNIDKKRDELAKLLKEFKSAVYQPTLFVSEFFDDLKNKIDIQFCKILNETNKSQMNEQIYKQQAELIEKVQEFESLCSSQINEESISDHLNETIEGIEKELNEPNISEDDLCRIDRNLSNEFKNIHIILFQDKFMFFLDAIEIKEAYDRSIFRDKKCKHKKSNKTKERIFSGFLITVDENFIRKELFETE